VERRRTESAGHYDGATIARKIDQNGRTPLPPFVLPADHQGHASVDFTRDQLIYKPRHVRVTSSSVLSG